LIYPSPQTFLVKAVAALQHHTLLVKTDAANQTFTLRALVESLADDIGGPYKQKGTGQLYQKLFVDLLPFK
jgi:hypothetical protein